MAHALAEITAPVLGRTAAAAQAGPIAGLSGRTAFWLVAIVVVAIAAVAIVPLVMDVRQATAWRRQLTDRLIDQAATDEDVRDLLRDLREPRGVRGLTRSVIAVLILALVGFALAVAMLSSGADSGDLRKTIVTSLMTVLATVAGFYFGTLGAQNSAEDARRHVTPRGGASTTSVTALASAAPPGEAEGSGEPEESREPGESEGPGGEGGPGGPVEPAGSAGPVEPPGSAGPATPPGDAPPGDAPPA